MSSGGCPRARRRPSPAIGGVVSSTVLLPAFQAARTLRQGSLSPPPTPRPHPSSCAAASSQLRVRVGPTRRGAQASAVRARAPSHGRLPLSDPEGPGAGRGEAPETQRDRVSPRALSWAAVWGFACQPGMEAPAPVPQGPGRWGSRSRPRDAGTAGLAWWDTPP